jgi:hypothetical protein
VLQLISFSVNAFQAEAGSEAENVFRFRPDGTQDKDLPVENRKEEI